MQEVALSLPFVVDAYGKIGTTTDQPKIWADRVRAVIGTNLRERLMMPNFGTLVPSAFMETDSIAASSIENEVKIAFGTFLTSLSLDSVQTSFDDATGSLSVQIFYHLPNNTLVDTTVSIITTVGNLPFFEENL
jgi:phage baseplate assembly protein W